jgi:hypothetical protein
VVAKVVWVIHPESLGPAEHTQLSAEKLGDRFGLDVKPQAGDTVATCSYSSTALVRSLSPSG